LKPRILVLGLGNVLLRDEGLGVRLVQRLQDNYSFPDNVELLDGGTLGLDLLPFLEGATGLILVDAVDVGEPPGTVVRWEGDDIPASLTFKLSPHQAGLADLLAAARLTGALPERIVLWGMQPAAIEPGLELTPEVEAAMPELEAGVLGELRDWGIEI
jgi:hydrogenase maturation protease